MEDVCRMLCLRVCFCTQLNTLSQMPRLLPTANLTPTCLMRYCAFVWAWMFEDYALGEWPSGRFVLLADMSGLKLGQAVGEGQVSRAISCFVFLGGWGRRRSCLGGWHANTASSRVAVVAVATRVSNRQLPHVASSTPERETDTHACMHKTHLPSLRLCCAGAAACPTRSAVVHLGRSATHTRRGCCAALSW